MGLAVVHTLPRGQRALVDSDVLDIGRRAAEGCPVVGWRGDPTASIYWNQQREVFEVELVDLKGRPYVAASHPRCDVELLRKLVAGDWQRVDPFAEMAKANEALERDRERRAQEAGAELADKLHFAVTRDVGHLEGGTRRQHFIPAKEG